MSLVAYPPGIVISTWVTAEPAFTTLFTFGLALFAIFCGKAERETGVRWRGSDGRVDAVSRDSLCTSPFLQPVSWRISGLRRWAVFTAGVAVLVVPWCVRSLLMLDELIPAATGIIRVRYPARFGCPFLHR